MFDDVQKRNILSLLATKDPESIRKGAQLAEVNCLTEAVPDLVRHILSPNVGVQEAVARALRKMGGAEAVQMLIPMLRSDNAPVRNMAIDLLRTLGGKDVESICLLLYDDDADIRIFAADILGSTGTVLAVPPLCRALLHDPEVNVRYQAAVSLGDLAFPEAVASLSQALEDEEWVQFSVVDALIKIRDESALEAMFKALGRASDLVASAIVDALGEMANIKAVPLLLRRLCSSPTPLCNKIARAVIRIMGERSLSLLGTEDCERLRESLVVALKDEDSEIQDTAVRGLAALGGGREVSGSILTLAAALDPDRDAERIAVIVNALVTLADIPELEQAVQGESEQVMRVALDALLRVDQDRGIALMVDIFWHQSRDIQRDMILEMANYAGRHYQDFFLDLLARHQDGDILRGALLFFSRQSDAHIACDRIFPLLSHPYDDVKEAALEVCIALGTPDVERHFREMAGHPDPIQRMMGVYGLGFFNLSLSSAAIEGALQDESPDVRRVAVEAFGRRFLAQGEHLSLLEERLTDASREVRMTVFDILGRCFNEKFIPYFLMGLSDEDPWVRVRCAECLGDNKVPQAVEHLARMLHDENNLVVLKVIETLGKIGGETAFRALLPVLEHRDKDIKAAVEEAINKIHCRTGA
ncbi:MAG: HEAT repeat domain-containing protein [Desulfovibrio sp.]|nr:HEAT repeat domain-containing protein [Desulfovibrio sp.]